MQKIYIVNGIAYIDYDKAKESFRKELIDLIRFVHLGPKDSLNNLEDKSYEELCKIADSEDIKVFENWDYENDIYATYLGEDGVDIHLVESILID